jgi:putative hydrolase of the HAD superfamily
MNAAPPPSPHLSAADARGFGHVDVWIFDLDNTLYAHEARVWPQVDERITTFIADLYGLDGLSARALQKYFYHRYGTTLKGLMDEDGIDPYDFLDFAHDIDHSGIAVNPLLGQAIERLPGRKLILTNGSRRHAQTVAMKLGVYDHFEDVFDIVAADYVPKPDRRAYERFLDKHAVDPARAAMF